VVAGVHYRTRRNARAQVHDARPCSGFGAASGRDPGVAALTGPRPECHPEGLRAAGWQQGCRLSLALPLEHVHVEHGEIAYQRVVHDAWVLVEQDCDLAWNAVSGSGSLIELRPVFHADPPADWGIRNARFLLDTSGAHIRAEAPGLRVTPDVVLLAGHDTCALPSSARRLKTWLGLRYDRPAVPEPFVDLARDIAARLRKKKNRPAEQRIRDILATFEFAQDGKIEYRLVAVVPYSEADADPRLVQVTRDWLSAVVLSVPDALGMPQAVDAYRDDQVSLAFLEHAFALDVTSVSWPVVAPGPTGLVD
jgi:hypothetical protein